ncbi:MAG: putative Ig domain-containing protein [Steroidobacteraceae bacterium]
MRTRWLGPGLLVAAHTLMLMNMPASALTLSGTASPATVGKPWSFRPRVTSGNAATIRFSINGYPRWASFNRQTGELAGTPIVAGGWANVHITAWDGKTSGSLAAFAITVQDASSSATVRISGAPSHAAEVGAYYSFRPTVSAPSGARLSYAIANKPSWASFNTSTGTLSGTPGNANIATYPNIVIRVTDAKSSASLPPFPIVVSKPVSGDALLSWNQPTKNTDGTPLRNLAGYRIRYGTSLASLGSQLTVHGADTTSASIEGLGKGTWYFAVVAYTDAGAESPASGAASKTIY